MSEWTADSNEALHLRLGWWLDFMLGCHDLMLLLLLVRTKEDAAVLLPNERKLTELFHPKFTYPVCGTFPTSIMNHNINQ
jgi:hypothetical protein